MSGAQPLDRRTEAARDPARDPGPAPPGAPPLVLGTAGHIDHGKTALVRALTGQDLDRLPEEKARGITIELGFAPLALADDLAVAIVDVPGHERFVRTMVAGASGLDLVMLVVAADEGVMPQTREHLAICELLGVERGLVVLTKSDLVDEEMLELATEDVRDALAAGPLADAPIVAASAQTGQGLDAVRATLEALVRTAPARRDDRRPARLAIDRVFTKHGFGTVATGTWTGRPLAVGAAVVLEPGARKARIRGLERHGEEVATSLAGARIAVNLQDRAGDEIHRGDVLTEPAALLPTTVFDATLRWLSRETPLAEPTSVELLCGTTERRARVAPIGEKPVEPGGTGFARIHVEGPPLALLPGDRFVIRGFARDAGVGATLGGGRVLDVAPPHRRRRDPALRAELERIARGDETAGLLARIERVGALRRRPRRGCDARPGSTAKRSTRSSRASSRPARSNASTRVCVCPGRRPTGCVRRCSRPSTPSTKGIRCSPACHERLSWRVCPGTCPPPRGPRWSPGWPRPARSRSTARSCRARASRPGSTTKSGASPIDSPGASQRPDSRRPRCARSPRRRA
ncbi:MAG: selenocysteine-specific translation elongation factor [Myxococcota bacterium]